VLVIIDLPRGGESPEPAFSSLRMTNIGVCTEKGNVVTKCGGARISGRHLEVLRGGLSAASAVSDTAASIEQKSSFWTSSVVPLECVVT